jgi:hypothetical protein
MPPLSEASVIHRRPDFTGAVDFDVLKSTVISCGNAEVLVGRRADVEEHLDHLFNEFSGQPLIVFYHAVLIVRMRRGEQIGTTFRDLWVAEGQYLKRNLRLRWLISACDTITDDDAFEPAEKALALAASILTATVKLYETERLDLGSGQQARPHSHANVQPLFDGITTFSIGYGDLVLNLIKRCRATARTTETAGMILAEVMRRLHVHDTVFSRFLNVHMYDDTRWFP